MVRVLTFACVIAVHTIGKTNPADSVTANGFEMLLHFTREAFFFLTGFVLVHQYLNRVLDVAHFYKRRLITVGGPYLAWSVIYTVLKGEAGRAFVGDLAHNLLWGTAWYHLYFLLVSMQIYLLYPLIARLIRATAGHHAVLLSVSAAAQIALLGWLYYSPPASGRLTNYTAHEDTIVLTYQFYVLAGAVTAYHLEQVRGWTATRRPLIAAVVMIGAAGALVWYGAAVAGGDNPSAAAAVLQPVMLVWSVAAICGLAVLGSMWAERRVPNARPDRTLRTASDRSFGVFLIHPAVLWAILEIAPVRHLPALPLTVLAYALTIIGSLVLVEGLRRSRLSLVLTGRPRISVRSNRKENSNDHELLGTARTPGKAALERRHDGDGRRVADAPVHRRGGEFRSPDRRDEARLGHLAGD